MLKVICASVASFVLGVMLALQAMVPEPVHLTKLPDGKWEVAELVKGFDAVTGTPIYWAIAQKVRDETWDGHKIEVHSGTYELLTFPREQVGDSPNDQSVDPRFERRTIKLEVKGGRGKLETIYSKNAA